MEEIVNDQGKLIFCGIVLLIIAETIAGLVLLMKANSFMNSATRVMATVTGSQAYGTGNGGGYYKLDVIYKDRMNNEYQSTVSQDKDIREGGHVEILYAPNRPEKCKPNNKMQIFILPLALTASVLPLCMMLVILTIQGIAKIPF